MAVVIGGVESTTVNFFNHHKDDKFLPVNCQSIYGFPVKHSLAMYNYDLSMILPNSWKIIPHSLDDSPDTDNQNIIFNNKRSTNDSNNNDSDKSKSNNNNNNSNNDKNSSNNDDSSSNNNQNNKGPNHPSSVTGGNQLADNQGSHVIAGPCGCPIGTSFDMDIGLVQRLVRVKVYHGNTINAIQVLYQCHDGQEVLSPVWGAQREKIDEIPLQPSEFLTGISGHCSQHEGTYVIKSLTFTSNLRTYGPFGSQEGSRFSLPATNGKIMGFHGNYGHCINSVGIYMQLEGSSSTKPLTENTTKNKTTENKQSDIATGLQYKKENDAKTTSQQKKDTDAGQTVVRPSELKPNDGGINAQNRRNTAQDSEPTVNKPSDTKYRNSGTSSESITPEIDARLISNKLGPYGGESGRPFDLSIKNLPVPKLVKVIIRHGWIIDAIQVIFRHDGKLVPFPQWGGNGGDRTEINLGQFEYLNSVSGYYSEFLGQRIIKSLTLHTSLRAYGPYGTKEGYEPAASLKTSFPFSMDVGTGKIIGFHGRYRQYLNSIGIHYTL